MTTYAEGSVAAPTPTATSWKGPDWLAGFADATVRDRLTPGSRQRSTSTVNTRARPRRPAGATPELSPTDLLHAKGWAAPGALDPQGAVGCPGRARVRAAGGVPTFAPDAVHVVQGRRRALRRHRRPPTGAWLTRVRPMIVCSPSGSCRCVIRSEHRDSLDRALDAGCAAITDPNLRRRGPLAVAPLARADMGTPG